MDTSSVKADIIISHVFVLGLGLLAYYYVVAVWSL